MAVPSWLNPPVDLLALSGPCPDHVQSWILANRAHPEATVACVAALYHTRADELAAAARATPRLVAEPLAQLAALEASHGHPNAAYVLGACAQFGRLCQRADAEPARCTCAGGAASAA